MNLTTPPSDPPSAAGTLRVESVENTVTLGAYYFIGALFLVIGALVMWHGGWFGAIPGLVFLLIGGVLFVGAFWTGLSMERFGEVWLEVRTPVYPGGVLQARIVCPSGVAGADAFLVELNCKDVRHVRPGSGVREFVIWAETARFPVAVENSRTHCDLRFDMPADAPLTLGGSTRYLTTPGIYWEVQVETEVEGVDLVRGFRFPVAARPETAPFNAAAPRMSSFVPPAPPGEGATAEGIGRKLGKAFASMLGGRRRSG